MTYLKTVWKNREVENPRTFNIQNNPDGTITLIPSEGEIIEAGTPIIAANMNNIEQGIKDAHDAIGDAASQEEFNAHLADDMPHQFVDNEKTYRWGFRTSNGQPQFIYEEV